MRLFELSKSHNLSNLKVSRSAPRNVSITPAFFASTASDDSRCVKGAGALRVRALARGSLDSLFSDYPC
jgi:hypothetical protein